MATATHNPRHRNTVALLGLALILCMNLPTGAQARAKRYTTSDATGEASPRNAGKTKFYRGSEETGKERDRRLSRECKGMTNAGACAGYTR